MVLIELCRLCLGANEFGVLEIMSVFLLSVGSLQKCYWSVFLPEEGCVWVLLQKALAVRERLHNLVTDHDAGMRQSTQVPYCDQLFEHF